MSRRRPLLLALAAAALFAASAAVAHAIRVQGERPYDIGFIPSAPALRWLSLGHPTLFANLLWLRAVQYMGDPKADQRGWEKLRPLVDVITDLDPHHGYAYQTTGNMLSASGRLADSNAILEKGTRTNPNRYILPFHRAVNAFMYAGDYVEAGRWFEIAARTPGAPPHLREYVLAMYAKGDTAEAAVSFLQRLREEAQDDESRRALDRQIKRAILERDATRIEEAAAEWRRRHFGIGVVALESLVAEGLLPSVPADPFGGTYYLDDDGRVRSTVFAERYDRPITGAARDRALRESRPRPNPSPESSR